MKLNEMFGPYDKAKGHENAKRLALQEVRSHLEMLAHDNVADPRALALETLKALEELESVI